MNLTSVSSGDAVLMELLLISFIWVLPFVIATAVFYIIYFLVKKFYENSLTLIKIFKFLWESALIASVLSFITVIVFVYL